MASHPATSPTIDVARAHRTPVSTESKIDQAPVVFILPGIDDDLNIWEPLQRAFDCRIVSYLDWTQLLGGSLETLASHVTAQIEEARPSRPIQLVGYSIGGSFGYAVAMALQAEGRKVSRLIVLDATAELHAAPKAFSRRLRERFEQFFTLASLDGLSSLAAKCLMNGRASPLLHRLALNRNKKMPLGFEVYLHRKITIQLMRRMYWSWWHKTVENGYPLTTPAILFRSQDHEPFESEDLGWRRLTPELTVIQVAATHEGMMDPENAAAVCAALELTVEAE